MYDDMNIILLNELKAIKVQVYYYGTEESAHLRGTGTFPPDAGGAF